MSSTSLCWCRAVKVQLSKYEFYTGLQNVLPYVCWTDCNYGMEPMLTVYTVVYDDQMLGIESCVGHVVSSRPNSKLYPQPSFFK